MHILYLGYVCHQEIFDELSKKDTDMSVASHKFETCFVRQLTHILTKSDSLKIVSFLPSTDIKSVEATIYYQTYLEKEITYITSERNNLKKVTRAVLTAKGEIKKWMKRTENQDRIVISYATNPILLAAFFSLSNRPRIVTICSEVPSLRIMTNGGNIINRIKKKVFSLFNEKMDGYVFMSRHMNELCNPKNKPWIVVEGMIDVRHRGLKEECKKIKGMVFYAGGLFIEYGIDVLLKSACLLENEGINFVLCGDGNAKELVEYYAKKCSNIKYLGNKKNDEILKLEKEAELLINPRKPDNLISRYSFPSKTFEYFSSGTPCITTKLDGIPEEYYSYCYTCDVSKPEKLAKDILEFFEIPVNTRERKAKEAFEFLLNKKSAKAQTEKIVSFLRNLI